MSDYQRTVEYLRDLRQGPLQNVTEEISHAATEFAALCVSANERLRKCTSLLQQGLRTEALHLADESPNLLDLVAALDLPDPAAWADFCQNNGLPVPPPLQLDRAAQLNDAYAQDQPLEHLLAQHRYLALARGPIGERLHILRKIASIDAGNNTWEKDIRVFEKARLKELPTLFYKAVRTKDEPAIANLQNEVNQQPWFESVPNDLSTAVADAFNRMQRATVEIELRKMVEPLREAFAAQSFQECKALMQQWKNVMDAHGVTVISPELTDEIRPVIAYVAEQERRIEYLRKFRDSCKAFGRMLDMDVPDAQLEVGYARLKEFNEPIPPELTQRYEAKETARQKVIDRKHRTRLIGIACSAAGVAVVVLVVFIFVNRAAAAREWATKIENLVATKDPEKLHRAQEYVSDLRKNHTGMLNEAPVARAIRDTEARQADFDRDSNTVQEFLGKFDSAAKSASTIAENQNANLDQLLAAAGTLNDTLTQANAAGDIAWADTPDKKFATGTAHVREILTALRARAATAVHTELDADSAKVDAIGPAPANMSEASDQLGTIASRLRTLVALSGLDDETRKDVTEFAARVDKRRDALTSASTVAGELDNIRQNASTADDLKKSLTGYLQRFPSDSRTQDFTASIDRLPFNKDIEAWHELVAPWAGQFVPPNSSAAQKRLDALAAYAAAHPTSPMTATATSYTDYLKRAGDALIEKGTWQTAFGDLFANPLLTDLAYMETSDGQRFYVLGDIHRTDRRINSVISITFEALNPTDPAKRMLVAVDPPATLTTKDPVPVPHAKVVGELNDQLKTINSSNWDTWGIDTAASLAKNKQISIVVKSILISQALRTENTVADWAIGDAYAQAITEFSRQKPENLSMLDPTRISAGTVKSLQTTIDSIPPANAMKDKLAAAKAALFKSVAFDVTSTAVLLKDDAGNWSVGGKTLAQDGNLWAAIPPAAFTPNTPPPTPAASEPATTDPAPAAAPPAPTTPPATLIQVGTVTAGKFALYDNAIRDLPQGTMIFITQP